uniref:Receptor transporter protein 2 n=1 Tax=Otolemur garnettii TaxID=30611 RepID=H0XSS6_OTOGA
MKIFRPERLTALHRSGLSLCSHASIPTLRTMCASLTTCEWKKVFYEKMEVAKPADSWELIIDPNLKPSELAPGWQQYVEQHASGRFHCSWCWHTWRSPHMVILFHMHLDRARYRIHVASRPDSGPHRPEFCEACQEGIVHWKPSQKLLEEEATAYASDACKPRAQGWWGYNFFSLRWCLFWAFLGLLVVYLQFSVRSFA